MLSLFKKVLCNFLFFIKTHRTIYKNYIVWKTCFHIGFECFKKHLFYKKKVDEHVWEQSQNKKLRNYIKLSIAKLYFETKHIGISTGLLLWRFYIKYGLPSKHLFQGKHLYIGWRKYQSNNKNFIKNNVFQWSYGMKNIEASCIF